MFSYNPLLKDGEQYKTTAVCMDKHHFAHCNYCSQSWYILTIQKKLCSPQYYSGQMELNCSFCASLEYYRPHIIVVR